MTLKVQECTGFSKEEAFKGLGFDPYCPFIKGTNSTQAWIKYGRPLPGSGDFTKFAEEQLEEKTKKAPGYGLYVILDNPILDTRKRPYTIINNRTEATREWKFVYMIREDELSVTNLPILSKNEFGDTVQNGTEVDVSIVKTGRIVEQCDNKYDAIKRMKELTIANHRDYSILAVKIPNINPVAAHCLYTPGLKTKKGRYLTFGYESE